MKLDYTGRCRRTGLRCPREGVADLCLNSFQTTLARVTQKFTTAVTIMISITTYITITNTSCMTVAL